MKSLIAFVIVIVLIGLSPAMYLAACYHYCEVDLCYYRYLESDYKTHPQLIKEALKNEYLTKFEYDRIQDIIRNENGQKAKLKLLQLVKE